MPSESWQWTCAFVVYHGPGFGHRLELIVQAKGRDPVKKSLGSWNGLGIPEPVLQYAGAAILAHITEHLETRYGIAGELPVKWAGEPDPF